ncbi:MAG: Mov34/MPN/PAD-1 family protein [Acidobacteriales bacterium]|nr:Mov34/MPN/PAD-1 family protein [Terriglobales bacterium]
MTKITLTVPPRIDREFKLAAKKAWPNEMFSYLLGTVAGDHVYVDSLYLPENVAENCTHSRTNIQPEWMLDAQEAANEDGLVICGDIHSHPYHYRETRGVIQDRVQSEGDLDCPHKWLVAAVCVVQEMANKHLRASLRFWGPSIPVELKKRKGA